MQEVLGDTGCEAEDLGPKACLSLVGAALQRGRETRPLQRTAKIIGKTEYISLMLKWCCSLCTW